MLAFPTAANEWATQHRWSSVYSCTRPTRSFARRRGSSSLRGIPGCCSAWPAPSAAGHDEAMERYSYILEKLREGDFHRLRAFQADGRARFSTWLTVAARRLCLDHHRTRYGRNRPDRDPEEAEPLRVIRRRLADSLSTEVDTDRLPDAGALPADQSGHPVRARRGPEGCPRVASPARPVAAHASLRRRPFGCPYRRHSRIPHAFSRVSPAERRARRNSVRPSARTGSRASMAEDARKPLPPCRVIPAGRTITHRRGFW